LVCCTIKNLANPAHHQCGDFISPGNMTFMACFQRLRSRLPKLEVPFISGSTYVGM
jgi:hypothetical protein